MGPLRKAGALVSPGMDPERKGEPWFEPVRALSLVVLLALPCLAEAPDRKVTRLWKAKIALIRKLAGP